MTTVPLRGLILLSLEGWRPTYLAELVRMGRIDVQP
jgi:hypothetical protein